MKLTTAPGLWPAFWLMPDRGAATGEQWKRADTGNGGMEFDVMEYLGRWGPFRYNIAMHWDGYGKEHKQTGTTTIYFLPDKDGFITAGVLWTPGLIVYYANGREIARWESPKVSTVQSDIMFTNVSGGWDNNGIDDSKLPDDYIIDYVRVWQRKDLASPADGPQPPAK
jgi:beta-glucanase (GH16 family)